MDILEKLQEEEILARNQRETAYKENDIVFGLYWLGVGAGILKAMDLIEEEGERHSTKGNQCVEANFILRSKQ